MHLQYSNSLALGGVTSVAHSHCPQAVAVQAAQWERAHQLLCGGLCFGAKEAGEAAQLSAYFVIGESLMLDAEGIQVRGEVKWRDAPSLW
jgi:hypothetical protein